MTAHDLFHQGKLAEAVAAVTDEVRQRPTEAARRLLLAEFLCFTGELDRADKQLDAIGHQDPKSLAWVQQFRCLIRGEQDRREYFRVGHMPRFIGTPSETERRLMEAAIRVREGTIEEAVSILDQAEADRTRPTGTVGGKPFDDFRDLDDLTASVLEVITSSGDYYWIPFARIESIEFFKPERPKDLLWRRARLIVADGPDGEVFVPALYPGADSHSDDAVRMGRTTDWTGGEGAPNRGIGQRMFLAGDEAVPIMDLATVAFDNPAAPSESPRTES